MREFLAACVIAVVLAVGALFVLDSMQKTSMSAYTAPASVRI